MTETKQGKRTVTPDRKPIHGRILGRGTTLSGSIGVPLSTSFSTGRSDVDKVGKITTVEVYPPTSSVELIGSGSYIVSS